MKYNALITLDLPNANEKQRSAFYEVLSKEKWVKITSLTTAWQCSFKEGITYEEALDTLKSDIEKAQNEAKVYTVEYAIQLGAHTVYIG